MKSLILSLLLVVSANVNAQTATGVELGKYTAVDVDSGTLNAKLELKADKTLTFNLSLVSCTGTYSIQGKAIEALLKCPPTLPEAKVSIDITNVTPQSVRSAKGVEVNVIIENLAPEGAKFMLKKAD